jgi:hypothetical protein
MGIILKFFYKKYRKNSRLIKPRIIHIYSQIKKRNICINKRRRLKIKKKYEIIIINTRYDLIFKKKIIKKIL